MATTSGADTTLRKTVSAEIPTRAGATPRCIAQLPVRSSVLPSRAASCPPDPDPGLKMPTGEVSFPDSTGVAPIEVELAKTPHDVERGLMFRSSMADDHGMLFKLDERRDHTFWMHNTCIPLDMLFVDDDGVIVGIVEGAAPLTDTTRSVGCPSVFVLEVNGGWARKRGILPGQRISIPFSAR